MDRLFNTNTGNIILSVIWGLGIALLFYMVCKSMGCFVMRKDNDVIDQMQFRDFGSCSSTYPPYKGDIVPNKCKHVFDSSPTADYNEQRLSMNCGDSRHCRKPGCYKASPMDSIFRAPSQQASYRYL